GKMSYDLRRLRLHGLIERIEKTHRYRVTKKGLAVVHGDVPEIVKTCGGWQG
nr:hypothetical protein [Xanthomonadales bacterium]NIX13882.1 hypothetical protein [Xanthomonadales bacterium]